MFDVTSLSGKRQFLLNLMLLLIILNRRRLKHCCIFLPWAVHFTPKLQQQEPTMGLRCCLEILSICGSVGPCAQNPGTTASKFFARKRGLPKATPRVQVGRCRQHVIWCWATTTHPISVAMRGFTSSGLPRRPRRVSPGPHRASAGGSPSQHPAALTLHQARSAG